MSAIGRAWMQGFRRVASAPAVVAGVLLTTLAASVPLALAMRVILERALGRSLVAESLASQFSMEWWQEFAQQASPFGATFSPNLMGIAVTLDNLGDLLDGVFPIAPLVAALIAYLSAWVFLSGGILDRYARQRRTHSFGFFSACGVYFFRFLRLALVAGALYWLLFHYVHPWLFDTWLDRVTEDVTVERTEFYWRALMYGIFVALLGLVNVSFDYAKVRAVVEDRRSMIGALVMACGFILRHPGRVAGLYALNTLMFVVAIAIWMLVAPGVGGLGASMWTGLAVGQGYILGRLILKLHFQASQVALFQDSLAHAAYTAAPFPAWPESPAAELISPGP